MKRKLLLIAIFCGIQTHLAFAQDRAVCEEIVAATVDAINTKTASGLESYLASDFSCSGQTDKMARIVLSQLIAQLNEIVTGIEKIDEIQNGDLTLTYEFSYSGKLGKRSTTFVFNPENQLEQLDLFTIQVKKLNNEVGNMEKPTDETITLPLERHGNLIAARATVNGISRRFLIDSGSPLLILNSKYVENSDSTSMKLSSAKGVNSSISGMDITKIDDFDFYGIKMRQKEVPTIDLSHLENGSEVFGLIGYEVYKDYDLFFDYDNKELTLLKPEITTAYIAQKAHGGKVREIPLEMASHIPYLEAKIGNRNVKLGVDCGAEANLLSGTLFDLLKNDLKNLDEEELRGADGKVKRVRSGTVKNMRIGNRDFRNTACVFNDMSHLNAGYKTHLDGLIGYEILSKQKTILSYRQKKLILID